MALRSSRGRPSNVGGILLSYEVEKAVLCIHSRCSETYEGKRLGSRIALFNTRLLIAYALDMHSISVV